MRYLIIGGSGYFRSYTGTGVYTSLKIYDKTDDPRKLPELIEKHYEECAGLFTVIDTQTGTEYGE